MSVKRYEASLSRSQGRSGWSVIFRHPARVDLATGRAGVRVRQGLGTDDEAAANSLKSDLDAMLREKEFWTIAARPEAEARFQKRAVDIFYFGMAPEEVDYVGIREDSIPLPSSRETPYRRALLLGTTGAGKTTLLRQLIGTDPVSERFPSTSTAKTTVHETEVVLDDGQFRAVVTFFPRDEVRDHLNECVSEAVMAAYREDSDQEILRRLLMHVNQRFRFNYVLGNGPEVAKRSDDDEEDDGIEESDEAEDDVEVFDLSATNALLERAVVLVRRIAQNHGTALLQDVGGADERDQRVIDELFEGELDRRLRDDEEYHRLADELMDEIESRFSLLDKGELRKSKQGWPLSWSWETEDRNDFIKVVGRFSSNSAKKFGQLLTPLVNGVRVAGPFRPEWSENDAQPPLVLLDGEGLGHTPRSSAALSTSVARRIEMCDAVILVDNATQPMQAAAVAAMKDLVSTGAASKLLIVFTHFDEVKGDNLPTASAKSEHVLASAENVLASIGEELGPFAERALRARLHGSCFFVANIDAELKSTSKAQARSIAQLRKLLAAVDGIVERPKPVPARPVYNALKLALHVVKAAESYRGIWLPRLGLGAKAGVEKEHWKRIWALTKRLGTPGKADEYDTLKPVAELRTQLLSSLYILLQSPVRWTPTEPKDDGEKQQIFEALADLLAPKILDLATRRVRAERMAGWQNAFGQSGRGSSFSRAKIIQNDIYDRAAPIPDTNASPDQNSFLNEVAGAVRDVCTDFGATLE